MDLSAVHIHCVLSQLFLGWPGGKPRDGQGEDRVSIETTRKIIAVIAYRRINLWTQAHWRGKLESTAQSTEFKCTLLQREGNTKRSAILSRRDIQSSVTRMQSEASNEIVIPPTWLCDLHGNQCFEWQICWVWAKFVKSFVLWCSEAINAPVLSGIFTTWLRSFQFSDWQDNWGSDEWQHVVGLDRCICYIHIIYIYRVYTSNSKSLHRTWLKLSIMTVSR